MSIQDSEIGRDATYPAGKRGRRSGLKDAYAAVSHSMDSFLLQENRFRLPERLQKKIDRFGRTILRAGERRGWT
jgi:hypothetical protein